MPMPTYEDRQSRIREIAKRLLDEGQVDVVVGYQAVEMPLRTLVSKIKSYGIQRRG